MPDPQYVIGVDYATSNAADYVVYTIVEADHVSTTHDLRVDPKSTAATVLPWENGDTVPLSPHDVQHPLGAYNRTARRKEKKR